MTKTVSPFIWYELMTSDVKAAEAFYRNVVGWDAKDSGLADRRYTIFSAGPAGVAGLMQIPEKPCEAGSRPAWMGYVWVEDVDACAEQAKAAGGKILRAGDDIPGIGRFAVLADPYGAVFALFKPSSDKPRPPVEPGAPGHIGWRELQAGDGPGAFAFYSGLFGWTKADAVDMGAHGVYQLFATGGGPAGGMMTKMPDCPHPFWLYYFNVGAIDAAAARTVSGGGKIINGPMQVPGGDWIVQCLDPQGAMFAMVSNKR